MKKGIIMLIAVCVLLFFSGYLMISSWDVIIEWPVKDSTSLTHINNACFDSKGNIYAIDNSKTRLIVADPQGIVTLKLKAKDQQDKTVSRFSDLAVDEESNLYVLKTVMNFSGTVILREDILKYPAADRTNPRVVARAVYPASQIENGPQNPKTKKRLEVGSEGSLHYYFAREYEIVRKAIPHASTSEAVFDLTLQDADDIIIPMNIPHTFLAGISGFGENSVIYSTKSGEVYRVDENLHAINVLSNLYVEVGNTGLPVNLETDQEQQLYYVDAMQGEIFRMDVSKGVSEPILQQPEIRSKLQELHDSASGTEASEGVIPKVSDISLISCIHANGDGSITAIISDTIFKIREDGSTEVMSGDLRFSGKTVFFNWCIRVQPLVFLLLIIAAWRIIFVFFFKRKISMAVKQPLRFMPVIIVAVVFASALVYVGVTTLYTNAMEDRLAMLVKVGTNSIDVKRFDAIRKPSDYMNEDFLDVYGKIKSILDENTNGFVEVDTGSTPSKVLGFMELLSGMILRENNVDFNIYTQLYKVEVEDDVVRTYICMNDKNDTSLFYPLDIGDQAYYADIAFNESDRVTVSVSNNAEGIWMYALGKIKYRGKTIGVYETGMEMTGFIQQQKTMILNILLHLAVVSLLVLFIFILFMFRATRPLRILKKSFEESANGNADALVTLRTGDESEELSYGFNNMFNKMSEKIKQRIDKITLISESYSRFFPSQFRRLLNREEITEVQLGDQSRYNMSIMFSNIRKFYSLSEEMTPEENFNFINSFLRRIGPVIPNYSGFINKYLGAGIMALFPNKAEDALKAAIEMRAVLDLYNVHRLKKGYKKIDIGIGLHKCPLMVGIVGEAKRVEGTVISEGVNLAETLEKITVSFGASIMVTSAIMDQIDAKDNYQYRLLGRLIFGEKKEPVTVYDVYHADPEELRQCKDETKDIFEAGIALYQQKNFADAKRKFVEVIKQNHNDEAAKIYFFLCDEYMQKGVPENWDGTVALGMK